MKIEVTDPQQFKKIWAAVFRATAQSRQIFYKRTESGIDARFTDGLIVYVMIIPFEKMRELQIQPTLQHPELMPESSVINNIELVWQSFRNAFMPDAIEIANFLD